MHIGKAIKAARMVRNKKMTQKAFADIIGVTPVYLCNIESGKRSPSIELIEKISKKLNMPIAAIFWLATEAEDIREAKRGVFKSIKPSVDSLIKSIL